MDARKTIPETSTATTIPAADAATAIRRKAVIASETNPLEDEVDEKADRRVMRMPESPFVQRKCAACEEEDKTAQHRPPAKGIAPFIQRQVAPPVRQGRRFKHHDVNVLIRTSCDDAAFGLDKVEEAFKRALDKIFLSDCIEASRRRAIQANLKKNGYDVRCLDSARLVNAGACAESTGFSIPANILTLGSEAFKGGSCGDLASTILHEIIHVTRGRFQEDLSGSCEASCFGFGSASPDLCKNIDVFGNKHP